MSLSPSPMPENQLLAALPAEEYQRLAPHLESVSLSLGQVLHEPGEPIRDVYFPLRALVSLVSTLEDGSTTEIGLVGNDGMVGISVFLGGNTTINQAVVQIADGAIRMSADRLKTEFSRGGLLQRLLLLYTQALLTHVSQLAACNRHHTLEERLARWLLVVQDYISVRRAAADSGIYCPDVRYPPFWCYSSCRYPPAGGGHSLHSWKNHRSESRGLGSNCLRVLFLSQA